MILHPDEQKALDVIDSALGAGDPHLAGMFTIFTRLAAGEGIPPDEDLVKVIWPDGELPRRHRSVPVRRPPRWPGRNQLPSRPLARRSLRVVLIPAALLVILGLIIYAGVTGNARCVTVRPARSAAAADYSPADYGLAGRVCPPTQAAAPSGASGK